MKNITNHFRIHEIYTGEPGARLFNIFGVQNSVIATLWQRPDPNPDPKSCIFLSGSTLKEELKKEIINQLRGYYEQS
ncbi:MAG: hypothetical protein POELPBGB_02956 [Bacteroidia bacterium]|nr:hypothetical protein [Bacteroidia bacterium]